MQELTEIETRASAAGKNSARDFQKAQAEAGKLQQQYDALLNKISEYEAKARAPFDAQIVTYKPTQTDLANNAAVEQQYAAAMASDQVYQKMIADAEQLRAKQYQVNQTVQQMKQAADDAGGTSSARYTELQGELEALRSRTQDLNDQLHNLGVTGNNTGGMVASAIGGAASRAFSTLQKGARSVLKTFGTLVKSGIGKITSGLAQSGMITAVVGGLNSAIDALNSLSVDIPDWVPVVGGNRLGFSIGHITAPQIPYLAQGAVIPPNREFLAILGDQTHGTNIEAPLETIEQAVANVMGNMLSGQMAGFEAVVSLLQQILEAIYGIEIGDETLAKIMRKVQRKQAIMRGGY